MRSQAAFLAGIVVMFIAVLLGFFMAVYFLSTVGIDTDIMCHAISQTEVICGVAFEKISSQGVFIR